MRYFPRLLLLGSDEFRLRLLILTAYRRWSQPSERKGRLQCPGAMQRLERPERQLLRRPFPAEATSGAGLLDGDVTVEAQVNMLGASMLINLQRPMELHLLLVWLSEHFLRLSNDVCCRCE